MNRNTLIAIIVLFVLFLLAGFSKNLILGNAKAVTLQPGSSLSGVISQSLGTTSSGTLPVEGQDYSLNVQYFENNMWAVGSVAPLRNGFNASLEVLQKQGNFYVVVLGPGSAFDSTQVQHLPPTVAAYVRSHAGVYNSGNQQ